MLNPNQGIWRLVQIADGVYLNPENGEPYSGSVYGIEKVESVPTDSMGFPMGCGTEFHSTLRDGKFHGSYSSHSLGSATIPGVVIVDCVGMFVDSGEYRAGEKCGRWLEADRGPSGEILLTHLDSGAVTYDPCPPGSVEHYRWLAPNGTGGKARPARSPRVSIVE